MSATLKRKTLRALLLPFQVQQDCWHGHEGHAHRFACQERADHPRGEIPLPAGIAHRDVIGAGVESPEAATGDEAPETFYAPLWRDQHTLLVALKSNLGSR